MGVYIFLENVYSVSVLSCQDAFSLTDFSSIWNHLWIMPKRGLTNCDLRAVLCQTLCTTSILNSYTEPHKSLTNRQPHNAFWYELSSRCAWRQGSVWHRDITCHHMCDNLSYYQLAMVISVCIHSLLGGGERRGWREADGGSWLARAQCTPKILIVIMT